MCRAINKSSTAAGQRERRTARVFGGWPNSDDADRLALLAIKNPRAAVPGIMKLFRGADLRQRALEKYDQRLRKALARESRPLALIYDFERDISHPVLISDFHYKPIPSPPETRRTPTTRDVLRVMLREYATAFRRSP